MAMLAHACDIAFCGPGSTALLASGYGTFTVCFDNTAERGPLYYPYGHGHLILQAHQDRPSSNIIESCFRDIAQYAITGNSGSLPNIEQWQNYFETILGEYLGKIRIQATQRVEIKGQNTGGSTEFHLKPLVYMGAEYYDTMQAFYRLLWELTLSGKTESTNALDILHVDTIPALCELLKPLEQMYELARFGSIYSQQIHDSLTKGEIEKAKTSSVRLQEVDDLIKSLGSTYAALEILCSYHLNRQNYMDEDNPILLARIMQQSYTDLQSMVLVLLDLKKSLFHTNLRNDSKILQEYSMEGLSDG
jgi:hypothetical protein